MRRGGILQNQIATQRGGRLSERKKETADVELSPSGGSGTEQASSDAMAVLFFLQKRKKRMGVQRKRAGNARPYEFYHTSILNVGATVARLVSEV